MNTRLYNVFDKHFDSFPGSFILIANKSNPWTRQQPCLFDYKNGDITISVSVLFKR